MSRILCLWMTKEMLKMVLKCFSEVFFTHFRQASTSLSVSVQLSQPQSVCKPFLWKWDLWKTDRCCVIVKHVDNLSTITDGRTTLKRVGSIFFWWATCKDNNVRVTSDRCATGLGKKDIWWEWKQYLGMRDVNKSQNYRFILEWENNIRVSFSWVFGN